MVHKHLITWVWEQPDWPEFVWEAALLTEPLAAARRSQGEVAGVGRLLDRDANLAAQLEVLTLEGVATSAIEGESFDPNTLRSSFARKLAGLPSPPRSVDGLVEVLWDATQRHSEPLSLQRVCAWQAALFPTGRSGLREIRLGSLRGEAPMQIVSGSVGHERVHYEAPPRSRLDDEMQRFLNWFNQPPADLDGLLRAGIAHAWFELIHPFEDGNGRVGRAILDCALAQDEQSAVRLYSLSARLMKVRDDYYAALQQLSRGTLDMTQWLRWFLLQFTAAIQDSERTVGNVLYKARFWLRHAQLPLNDRQRKALNALLDRGPAGFLGGLSNKKYASLNKTSPATAQRDLAALVELGCLVLTGAGRSARYELSESS